MKREGLKLKAEKTQYYLGENSFLFNWFLVLCGVGREFCQYVFILLCAIFLPDFESNIYPFISPVVI